MASTELNQNYLLYQHFYINHANIDFGLAKFSQFRHFHGNDSRVKLYSIMILLGSTLARSINATLIGRGHPSYNPNRFPTFSPFLTQVSSVGQSVENYWNYFKNVLHGYVGMPLVFRNPYLDITFAYCADIKTRQESLWNFSMFTDALDQWTWLFLFTSVILISFLTQMSGFIKALFVTLEALITPGVSGNNQHNLLTLWMLNGLVLVTFYLGNMTSHIISPSQEDTIADITELRKTKLSSVPGRIYGYFCC